MKKKKTGIFILLGLIFIIAASALISNITTEEEVKFNDVTYSEYKKLYESKDLVFVYVGREGCGYCQQTVPLLKSLQTEEDMVWNYLDTDTMSQSDFEDIAKTAEVFAGNWGTPTLLAIKDGKVMNSISGYREKEILRTFIKDSKDGKAFSEATE